MYWRGAETYPFACLTTCNCLTTSTDKSLVGSAIYTPAIPYIEHIYHTIPVVASLGLALYVLGYGVGPLLFSPLSEIPIIGRNPPYM